jgi:hypothetical protein
MILLFSSFSLDIPAEIDFIYDYRKSENYFFWKSCKVEKLDFLSE